MNSIRFCFCLMTFVLCTATGSAVETAPRISDREIIESLASLKAGQKALEEGQKAILRELDKRFESIDKRFEELRSDMNKRFETIDQRFEDMNKRFEEQSNLLVGIMVTFGGMVAVMIGFAIWDRRTMIRPFETKVRHIENELVEPLAQELRQDRQRFQALLEAVRALAKNDIRVAEALKSVSLL